MPTAPPEAALAALIAAEGLPETYRETVDTAWKPLAALLRGLAPPDRALVVGLSGPQGGGKTTAAQALTLLLQAEGLAACAVSIDDFYLTRAERRVLAESVHPLLATRGPPGTHDLALALATLDALRARRPTTIPRFDKAADDRAPRAEWRLVATPMDVVILEGWCVGAGPSPAEDLATPFNALERDEDPDGVWRAYVEAALVEMQALFARLDILVQIVPPDFDVVAGWRREQEAKLRARRPGAPGLMDDAAIARFVAHYERITRRLIAEGPARADVVLRIGPDRQPLRLEVRTPAQTEPPPRAL